MSPEEAQFKVRLAPETIRALEESHTALGLHSANALAAIIVTEFAGVPAPKIWEALAKIRAYHRRGYKGGKRA